MADSLHHLHKRKRVHEKLEPYPHPDRWKSAFDNLVLAVALFSVLMTIPQAAKIWLERDAAGVSPLSWGAYLVASIFWTSYGIVHRERNIVVIYALFTLLNLLVVAGALAFG